MVNYQQGKIYQITNNVNDKMYVGSTCQTLSDRMIGHRGDSRHKSSKFYKAMRDIGIENFSIYLYKTFPCQSKVELEAEEYRVMKEHQESGVELYNDYIGTKSKEHREKLSAIFTGERNHEFNYGGISFRASDAIFIFFWNENKVRKSSSFSCNKYGVFLALQKAQDARKAKYPEWQTPEEQTWSELRAIEC